MVLSETFVAVSYTHLKDKVQPALDEKISSKDIINIKRAVEIEMVVGSKTIVIKTAEDTVKDMLEAERDVYKRQYLYNSSSGCFS